jgi:isopenicillin N synthase-like dioxygenase
MLEATREFFALQPNIKDLYRCPSGNKFRGYTRDEGHMSGERDDKEGFEVAWFEDRQGMLAAGYSPEYVDGFDSNIWPSLPGSRSPWRRYFECVKRLGDYLLEIAAQALELPPDWFAPKFSRQDSYMLANFYPAQENPTQDGRPRFPQHTDYGAFTILYQDSEVGGLEVQCRDGTWLRVPYIPETFVVNLGDLFAKWTNDRWVATPHRVLHPRPGERREDRISVPYFQHSNLDAMIETIPTCIAPGETPRHAPVLWRDWNDHCRADYNQVGE